MLNPQILWSSKLKEKDWEGCLSVPGIRALVPRAKQIQVSFHTRDGMPVTAFYEGFIARIIQHEIDHLAGLSFLERVDNNREMISEAEYKKRIQGS